MTITVMSSRGGSVPANSVTALSTAASVSSADLPRTVSSTAASRSSPFRVDRFGQSVAEDDQEIAGADRCVAALVFAEIEQSDYGTSGLETHEIGLGHEKRRVVSCVAIAERIVRIELPVEHRDKT